MDAPARASLSLALVSPSAWHRERHAAIVEAFPEVRALSGPNPWTTVAMIGVVTFQLGVAYALRTSPVWLLVAAAFFVGAFAVHALGVLIHEATHNLVFHSTTANKVVALVANLPLVFPGAIDFREKHLAHHRHLGEGPALDFQTPPEAMVAWAGTSRVRKTLWLVLGSLVSVRSLRTKKPAAPVAPRDPWLVANAWMQLAASITICVAEGPRAVLYLLFSGLFAFGAHPVSLRGTAEHFDLRDDQPTNSYYGPLNLVSFNVGYHVEHHDVPTIPWNRLPALRRRAPSFYAPLMETRSWVGLWLRFMLDRSLDAGRYVSGLVPSPVRPSRDADAWRTQTGRVASGVKRRRRRERVLKA